MKRTAGNGFAEFLEDARTQIDDAMDRSIPPLGSAPAVLHEAMRYTLLAPGKRVRGAVVLAVTDLLKGRREDALPPACAVEMVHASSLILDDLPSMDNASLRRGKPPLHRRIGEANAILASVALLNRAFEVIHQASGIRERLRVQLAEHLHRAIGAEGLIGGQVADLESTGEQLELETLEYIHSHKTGALFIAATQLGALVAGARPEELEALRRYAKNLGLAFQITDDLLDYSGDPGTLGKDAGQDRDHTTFVSLSGIDGARQLVDDLIDASASALERFGRRAGRLIALAEFVRNRDR
jgi:geranylgeranyl diphosphate synthase type II